MIIKLHEQKRIYSQFYIYIPKDFWILFKYILTYLTINDSKYI